MGPEGLKTSSFVYFVFYISVFCIGECSVWCGLDGRLVAGRVFNRTRPLAIQSAWPMVAPLLISTVCQPYFSASVICISLKFTSIFLCIGQMMTTNCAIAEEAQILSIKTNLRRENNLQIFSTHEKTLAISTTFLFLWGPSWKERGEVPPLWTDSAFFHHQQGRIDFNTGNPSLSTGKDFLIHSL